MHLGLVEVPLWVAIVQHSLGILFYALLFTLFGGYDPHRGYWGVIVTLILFTLYFYHWRSEAKRIREARQAVEKNAV